MPRDADGHLTPGRLPAARAVPRSIPRPEYVGRPAPRLQGRGDRYDDAEIARIRAAGRAAARALEAGAARAAAGVTTAEIDAAVHESLVAQGAYPSTLGYRGFPASCCTSVNEVICHGIPDDTVLQDGDIVNIDVTAYLDGMHGDLDATFEVGEPPAEVRALVAATREALTRAIRAVAPGRRVNVIGRAIESYAARGGYGVVREYTGHGVGVDFHSGLVIPHHDDPLAETVLEPGMVFTIEPMLTLGDPAWEVWPDDWTVVTRDRSPSAQFEHTLVVTERGAEILTLP